MNINIQIDKTSQRYIRTFVTNQTYLYMVHSYKEVKVLCLGILSEQQSK